MPPVALTGDLSEILNKKSRQYTQTIFGSRQQPISVEIIAEDDQHLLTLLHKAGWRNSAASNLRTLLQQIKHQLDKSHIPVAPAFWNGKINNFALVMPDAKGTLFNILYLWKTPYRISNAQVYVGMTRTYNGKKWMVLHNIGPDVDASREKFRLSLQRADMIKQSCLQAFVPEMTGEYLLKGHFFTRGKILKLSLLSYVINRPVFCFPENK
jgi:undecaprenyl-diphosphatase